MRRLTSLLFATSLALGSGAAAIDLTGTWVSTRADGYAKCRRFDGAWQRSLDSNVATLYVTQVGTTLYVQIAPGGGDPYENEFKGEVSDAFSDPEKGVASATACDVDGEYYQGVFWIPKAQADAERGVMTVEYIGTGIGQPHRCKAKFERTSAADPVVGATCP